MTWTYPGEVTLDNELYVVDAWVIRDGTTYEMWYTHAQKDLSISGIIDVIKGLSLDAIIGDIPNLDLAQFLNDLGGLDVGKLKDLLDGTSTVIGYATSSDGIIWTPQTAPDLVGSSGSPWSSVAAPSVAKTGDRYEMWYTEGIDELTWQNLIDLVFGDNLPIGYLTTFLLHRRLPLHHQVLPM